MNFTEKLSNTLAFLDFDGFGDFVIGIKGGGLKDWYEGIGINGKG